jgi:flagellar hook-associated protein 2
MSTSLPNLNLSQSSASSGTGIDVGSIVDQLIYAEQAPERIWQQQKLTLASQAMVLNSLSSAVSALKDAFYTLSDISGSFAGLTATSSQPNLVTATAQSDAATGVHTIIVDHLATMSSYYTDAVATSSTTLAHGTFTLAVGSTSNTITIDDTNDTLDKLAAYINAHDYGVQASVLNDANGARLALVSKTSGTPGDLTVSANGTGLGFHKSVDGVNAGFTIDGVPLSSTTNTATGAIPGVILNLLGASPDTPITVSVSHDTAGITSAIKSFVSAYNSVMRSINGQFTTDSSGNAGALAGNSALRSLQSSILSDAAYSVTGNNGIVGLTSMGINMQDDGTLSIDSAKLNDALTNNFSAVQSFFQSAVSDSFGANFSSDLASLTSPASGLLAANIEENTSNQRDLTDRINDFEARLVDRRQFLINVYSQVDTMLRQYPLMVQQINSQLGNK